MAQADMEELVPDDVIPHKTLPPLRYRDLPEAPPWTQLVGPSVILAGLALGSGEFVFWPYITYRISSTSRSSGGPWRLGKAPSPGSAG